MGTQASWRLWGCWDRAAFTNVGSLALKQGSLCPWGHPGSAGQHQHQPAPRVPSATRPTKGILLRDPSPHCCHLHGQPVTCVDPLQQHAAPPSPWPKRLSTTLDPKTSGDASQQGGWDPPSHSVPAGPGAPQVRPGLPSRDPSRTSGESAWLMASTQCSGRPAQVQDSPLLTWALHPHPVPLGEDPGEGSSGPAPPSMVRLT